MDNLFLTRALTAAVNKMRPVKTPILDKLFRRRRGHTTDRLAIDIKLSAERVLPNISVYAPATVESKTDRKVITLSAPRFAPKRLISAADLNAVRAWGQEAGTELLATRIGDEQEDMRLEIDRTREFMAVKSLQGSVVDGDGTTLVDFGFSEDQQPELENTDAWDDDASDPVADLRAWKRYISNRVPMVTAWYGFCGSDAMDALLNNTSVQNLLKYQRGAQIAEEGRIANLAGVEIEEYFGSYKNSSGVVTEMYAAKEFILVGYSEDAMSEHYAPVMDLEAPTGVGTGQAAQMFFSKAWDEKDPSGKWIKVEARPLPVINRPEAIVRATVLE